VSFFRGYGRLFKTLFYFLYRTVDSDKINGAFGLTKHIDFNYVLLRKTAFLRGRRDSMNRNKRMCHLGVKLPAAFFSIKLGKKSLFLQNYRIVPVRIAQG
jgi:hypothetical protein